MKLKLKLFFELLIVCLVIGMFVLIPNYNNYVLNKFSSQLFKIELPDNISLIDTYKIRGNLNGNGNTMEEKNDSARTPEIIENSSLPTQNQKKSKEIDAIYGKWKFTKRISYPKAYSQNAQTLCDNTYLGRTIEIKKELFQGKTFKIENPFYNMISISNPYELMSGYGYLRNSVLKKYIPKEEKYNLLELLENRPENKDNDPYINFEDECYQDNDIWTLLVIDDDTMIFFEDGCFEVKKNSDRRTNRVNGACCNNSCLHLRQQ